MKGSSFTHFLLKIRSLLFMSRVLKRCCCILLYWITGKQSNSWNSHSRKENKIIIVYMSELTSHLFMNISTRPHKNAYICAECILIMFVMCTTWITCCNTFSTKLWKSYRMVNNVLMSWHPVLQYGPHFCRYCCITYNRIYKVFDYSPFQLIFFPNDNLEVGK